MKLAQELRALADRFSEGWHEGIKIDASDIVLLSDAAEALAEQPAQPSKPWVGLTDDEILYCVELENPKAIAEEVEAKLREKNQ